MNAVRFTSFKKSALTLYSHREFTAPTAKGKLGRETRKGNTSAQHIKA
jgi:hypothetical protein